MKIQYFSDTDTLYLNLANRPSTESTALNEDLVVDFDKDGNPVSITIEHYSKVADSTAIETLLPSLSKSIAA